MNTLLVILGPTGVGKTELSLQMAEFFGCPILSSDSRQIFKEMKIGTAMPTPRQLARVKHYFIATHSIFDTYSAGQYEADALQLMETLFRQHDTLMLVGGSMLYIDAVCKGLDDIPNIPADIREKVKTEYEQNGLEWLQQNLQRLDPVHYAKVDTQNHKRMLHALEVCISAGKPYSSFCTGKAKERPFKIVKIGLNRPRPELYERINKRVDEMMQEGLLAEAQELYPYRHLNPLNTVGYKELFNYMDGTWSLDFAVNMVKQDSRHYAKRQLTWFNADKSIQWFHPDEFSIKKIKDLKI